MCMCEERLAQSTKLAISGIPSSRHCTALPGNLRHACALPRTSGARYSGVPHSVYVLSVTIFANPKSTSFKYPSASMSKFSGCKHWTSIYGEETTVGVGVVGVWLRLGITYETLSARARAEHPSRTTCEVCTVLSPRSVS